MKCAGATAIRAVTAALAGSAGPFLSDCGGYVRYINHGLCNGFTRFLRQVMVNAATHRAMSIGVNEFAGAGRWRRTKFAIGVPLQRDHRQDADRRHKNCRCYRATTIG